MDLFQQREKQRVEKEEVIEKPVKKVKEEANKEIEEIKVTKTPLIPRTDYVSKFEEFADSSKKEEASATKKKKKSQEIVL